MSEYEPDPKAVERRAHGLHDLWCAWFHEQHPTFGFDDDGAYNIAYEDLADKTWYRQLATWELRRTMPPGMTVDDLRKMLEWIETNDGGHPPVRLLVEHCLSIHAPEGE